VHGLEVGKNATIGLERCCYQKAEQCLAWAEQNGQAAERALNPNARTFYHLSESWRLIAAVWTQLDHRDRRKKQQLADQLQLIAVTRREWPYAA
jgi:hypothetical protein